MKFLCALLLVAVCVAASAAEVIPPAPKQYFNDTAGVVQGPVAATLNQRLADFERQTSSQILVAVYPKMQSDSSIEDYTVRVAQAWKVGQKARNNGAVLFVFVQDRKLFIQVGYGLEGALPDGICKRIIEDEIKPHFRTGDFSGGLTAGVNAILAATRGEYKGTGRTAGDLQRTAASWFPLLLFGLVILLFVLSTLRRRFFFFTSRGWANSGLWSVGSGWDGGSGGGGGWSSGGGGGDFSGGGGSFGGGGAGGSW